MRSALRATREGSVVTTTQTVQKAFSQDFYGVLRSELDAAHLLMRGDEFRTLRQDAVNHGLTLWSALRSAIGERSWKRAQQALPKQLSELECGRVLGFGAALTRFAISTLALSPYHATKVAELGALTNFIVGVYDTHLDFSAGGRPLLDRSTLLRLLTSSRHTALDGWARLMASPQESVFLALVREFMRRLRQLAHCTAQTTAISDIMATIVTMYDAQHACNSLRLKVRTRDLQDKGALPIVVMGVPAWLVRSQVTQQQIVEHRRWLYRLGDFLTLIDASADLYSDSVNGQANRIERILERNSSRLTIRKIAEALATKGAALANEPGCDPKLLAMVVTSWLEGPA